MKRDPRSLSVARSRAHSRRHARRNLAVEKLEARELMALLRSGTGDGHLSVQVNEYGAFGRSGTLESTSNLDVNDPREIGDAFYDPVGPTTSGGTTFVSALAIKVGGDDVVFLTDGTIGTPTGSVEFQNGSYATPIDPNNRILNSVFYYPNTVPPNGNGAVLRINLRQEITTQIQSGTTPVGVTLTQQYTITNLTGSNIDVQIWRYFDGDLLMDNNFVNDGAGMRQVIQNDPERVWMTNTATNTNRNDPTYIEIRSDPTGVVRPDRWEVGLSKRAVVTNIGPCTVANPCKNVPFQAPNGPLLAKILADTPLADDIVRTPQADIDGNNKVDNGAGDDWSVALRNFYTIGGNGSTVYTTETEWGDPELGDPEPPVIPDPQRGTITGTKFSDRNGNGVRDTGETGAGGFRIYADVNNNSAFDAGEPSAFTDANGFYQFVVDVGTFTIREVPQTGWTQTFPAGGAGTSVTVATAGQIISGINFGNQAMPVTVSGTVFDDIDRDSVFDVGEPGLAGAFVYADLNNNGAFEVNEPSVTTSAGGTWSLANLDPRSYVFRQVPPPGYDQTFPGGGGGQVVNALPGQNITGINFGDAVRPGQINGKVYLDVNGNGAIDPGEPGAQGVIVYLDRDNNCNIGLGENGIVTGPDGTFGIQGVLPGTYVARLALPAGLEQTLPSGGTATCGAGIPVTIAVGTAPPAIDFLVTNTGGVGPDFGDAPPQYPVTLAQNGARHTIQRNFGLGALQDGEIDGQPSTLADGDDSALSDDEDGIFFNEPLRRGQVSNVTVVVETGGFFMGRLQGWIDFNNDGDWNDPGEWVMANAQLPAGTHQVPIFVPHDAVVGRLFSRWRYGYEFNLGPTGPSIAGEVEDHALFVVGNVPIATDDAYTFATLGEKTLDVLANDIPSQFGDLVIESVAPRPGFTGTLVIAADGKSISYTPSGQTASEQFEYVVRDPQGNTDTALVSITVTLPPLAIDDTFLGLPQNAQNFPLNVLANDFAGVAPLTIITTSATTAGGTVSIAPGGGSITYTAPSAVFNGIDTFTYTVVNGAGLQSTAEVTVEVTPSGANDLVALDVQLLKLNNQPLDDNIVGPGQLFNVRVTTDDLRTVSPQPTEARGVFAAYFDLLYDSTRLEIVADPQLPGFNPALGFNIVFGSAYNAAIKGNENTAGIINEVGAAQDQNGDPLGPAPVTLFTVTLRARANAPAGSALIVTDPADDLPDSDTLLYEPPSAVPLDQIRLDSATIVIDPTEPVDNSPTGPQGEPTVGTPIGGGGGGGEPGSGRYSNRNNIYDVNGDGSISPLDALIVINSLNNRGPRSLVNDPMPSTLLTPIYYDVSGDDFVSATDALLIITRLNSRGQAEGEPEMLAAPAAESAAAPASLQLAPGETVEVTLLEPTSTSSATSSPTLDSAPLALPSAPARHLPRHMPVGASAAADFGPTLGSDDKDDDSGDLLLELAIDACLHWRD